MVMKKSKKVREVSDDGLDLPRFCTLPSWCLKNGGCSGSDVARLWSKDAAEPILDGMVQRMRFR